MSRVFRRVGGVRPRRSLFNLSYEKKFTCDMGQLIPVMCDEVVPGDVFRIKNEIVLRFQPLVAPILHEVNVYVHYFFVPYRLLWSDWEDFITGGKDGEFTAEIPTVTSGENDDKYSLWDYFGLPLVSGVKLNAFPFRAYKFIWNEYYRDENLQDELDITDDTVNLLQYRCWEKDYFTSSLPWQQRGVSPAMPVGSGSRIHLTSQVWSPSDEGGYLINAGIRPKWTGSRPVADLDNPVDMYTRAVSFGSASANDALGTELHPAFGAVVSPSSDSFSMYNASADAFDYGRSKYFEAEPALTSWNISDLRLAFQVQKWLERNARSGCRYTEQLRAHFGVSPRDERLQRPEYIGGSKSPIIVSEVLQTSQTSITAQGNLAGHGLTADMNYVAKYRAQEFGLIMGIMSIMPRCGYNSQGIDRQWLRTNKYDYPFPEFVNLSEQAVYKAEIYATPNNTAHIFSGTTTSSDFFGYQGRLDELRTKNNMCCAEMRDELAYWHLNRNFSNEPELNSDFVTCKPSKRIFAVEDGANGIIVNFANVIKALRPIPAMSEPGLIDHN